MSEETLIAPEAETDVDTSVLTDDSQLQSDETSPETQESDTEPKASEEPASEYPEGISSKQEWVEGLLAKEHDPTRKEYTDAELDVLEEYWDGNIDMKPDPKSDKKPEKKPEAKEESKEEAPNDDLQADEETIKQSSSLDLAILKELGAKTKSEVVDKIKGLRQAISGKLEKDPGYAEAKGQVEFLTKAGQNNTKLWSDLMSSDARAQQFVKTNYGLVLVKAGADQTTAPDKAETSNDPFHIPREKFIDEEAADAVNSVLAGFKAKMEDFDRFRGEYEATTVKTEQKLATSEAQNDVVDEMVRVADGIPQLKAIPDLREAVIKWRGGQDDPRMNYFKDLFEIANKSNVNLVTAMEIDRGRKSSLAVLEAKIEGKKEAYSHKPNRSLSDIQGKTINSPEEYSDSQITELIEQGKIPEHWFNENDEPDPSKMPKNAWIHFWPGGVPFK